MSDEQQPAESTAAIRFDVFTLFPAMFEGPLSESILRRAVDRGLIEIHVHDIRDWTQDRHRTADDTPYGGGAGMVMKAPPIVEAVEGVLGDKLDTTAILHMAAGGRRFTQAVARDLTQSRRIALICGHYEGIDDRVITILGGEELSVGDYVLTGGELPAMIVIDAVTRLVPGVIDEASIDEESFGDGLLEYPHFTRPVEYRGHAVPEILLSGHHANIRAWRRRQAIRRTARHRPDLIAVASLPETERISIDEARSDAIPEPRNTAN
jgi:tRNA (guanine37-N1)-methyltransferase